MSKKGDSPNLVTRNLHAAIERIRDDVDKVEFWAEAVSGFSQPVPDYKPADAKIWLPQEQARELKKKPRKAPKTSDDSTRD